MSELNRTVASVFGQRLAVFRREAGLTQDDVAHLSSLHRSEIGLLERGQRQPSLLTIVKVAGALGVAPCELIEGLTWIPPAQGDGSLKTP